MRTVLNVLNFVLGGFATTLSWLFATLVSIVLIFTLPLTRSCWEITKLSLIPYGNEAIHVDELNPESKNALMNTGGTLLNLRLNKELVSTDRGLRNLGSMIRAYFSLWAFHVQFNTISTEELREAQAHPEEYRDLLVRVAGYSTQFVNLSKEMQEAIIARTEHGSF